MYLCIYHEEALTGIVAFASSCRCRGLYNIIDLIPSTSGFPRIRYSMCVLFHPWRKHISTNIGSWVMDATEYLHVLPKVNQMVLQTLEPNTFAVGVPQVPPYIYHRDANNVRNRPKVHGPDSFKLSAAQSLVCTCIYVRRVPVDTL